MSYTVSSRVVTTHLESANINIDGGRTTTEFAAPSVFFPQMSPRISLEA
jgi:hypothetical protein